MTAPDTGTKPELNTNCDGVQECYHSIIQTYGREAFDLVMMTGLAQQGLSVVMEQAQKYSSRKLAAAGNMLGASYNTISNHYLQLSGISQETLAAVEQEIQRAFAAEAPRVQLLH